jgi:hypothetical protein
LLGPCAAYWDLNGKAVDLNTLIDPASGWRLTSANSISDTGWIAGYGYFDPGGPNGQVEYYRLFSMQVPLFVAGDFDRDGAVDGADFLKWQRAVGMDDSRVDANDDGIVDGEDLAICREHFGEMAYAPPLATAVPEPGTLTLSLLQLALLCTAHSAFNRKGPPGLYFRFYRIFGDLSTSRSATIQAQS